MKHVGRTILLSLVGLVCLSIVVTLAVTAFLERVPTATPVVPATPRAVPAYKAKKMEIPRPSVVVWYTPTPRIGGISSGLIGRWISDLGQITISVEAGHFTLVVIGSDRTDSQSLKEMPYSGGRRFDATDGSGEYYIIDRRGDLEIWSPYGLVSKGRKRG